MIKRIYNWFINLILKLAAKYNRDSKKFNDDNDVILDDDIIDCYINKVNLDISSAEMMPCFHRDPNTGDAAYTIDNGRCQCTICGASWNIIEPDIELVNDCIKHTISLINASKSIYYDIPIMHGELVPLDQSKNPIDFFAPKIIHAGFAPKSVNPSLNNPITNLTPNKTEERFK